MSTRIVKGKMVGWNVEIDRSLLGRDHENNATTLAIETELEPCAYTLDILVDGTKYTNVMAVYDGMLEYTFPASLMVVGRLSMQIIGTFADGTVIKSNLFGAAVNQSINATEEVPESTATDFQQALAAYSKKLAQAIEASHEAAGSAQIASDSASSAEQSLEELKQKIASGEFKGDKGDKGDTGEKGETGERGQPGTDGKDGSDASVTSENIKNALGFEPAKDEDTTALKRDLAQLDASKITKPSDAPQVGKVLKIKSVNEDGTFVCEWADDNNDGAVSDVKVNGNSIVA